MDISNLPPATAPQSRVADTPTDVLSRLQQLGSIQARVVSVANGQALLLTQLGEITGNNALKLKAGDAVQVRLDGDKQNPVLKVTPLPDQVTLLAANKLSKLLPLLPANRPTPATIVSHQGNTSQLQLGQAQASIPLQSQFKAGQLLTIVHHQKAATVEIKPVDHQPILRSALARLISARPQSATNNQMQPLLQLVQSALNIQNGQPPTAATPVNNSQTPAGSVTANANANSGSALPLNTTLALLSGLESLVRSLPAPGAMSHPTIQKWVQLATQSTPGDRPDSRLPNANPLSVLRQLPQTEQGLTQLIELLLKPGQQRAEADNQPLKRATVTIDEPLLTQFREAIKSTEQSLNQQLFQQTSLRFQQELQQPIAFNLTIPFMEQQTIKSLQLKIRQKSKEADADNQAWEIRLNFEFGSLGLISTHILLDGNTLSTSFWAVEDETKDKIDAQLPVFQQQLVKSGFNLGNFQCYSGQPVQDTDQAFSPIPDSLLDIKV